MAEPKKDAPKDSGPNWIMFAPVIFLGVAFILSAYFSGQTIFNYQETPLNEQQKINNPKSNYLSPYSWIGEDTLATGVPIINFKEVVVRNAPAGMIIGTQDKLKTGIVRAGPVNAFGIEWWRVDYEEAPSGWIESNYVSTHLGWVRTLNIFPIIYGFFKPIGYVLLVAFLLVLLYLKILNTKESNITSKKLQLKKESAQGNIVQPSLAEQISAKPDIQEIPGFQTEEIVPVQILEQQNRWKHIQDLIKSYNQNDWRQAIIEADIILEEMLEKMGYPGVTIGDKLKMVERSDFVTVDKAWSAHKVRNQIAHDGSSFKLSREVAEQTIKNFEEVFKEFYYI